MQLNLFRERTRQLEQMKYEFFLLISPSYAIKEKVAQKKHQLHEEIGLSNENLRSIGHISLFKFLNPYPEDFLKDTIKRSVQFLKPFTLEIDELQVYDHNYTKSIVLKFKNDLALKKMRQNLFRALSFHPASFDPHLTIARSIPLEDFNRIGNINDYFVEGKFECDKITVLRKPLGSKQKYEIFSEIMFPQINS
jgi:2'-5' RNA ligase